MCGCVDEQNVDPVLCETGKIRYLDAMRTVGFLMVSLVLMMHHVDSIRIDKGTVAFSSTGTEAVHWWESFFEKAASKRKKIETCNNASFKVVNDEELSRCVRFTIFCRNNRGGTELKINDLEKLIKSGFNPKNTTVIIIHGYFHEKSEDWMGQMTNAFIEFDDINVMQVMWAPLSDHVYYPLVVQNAVKVASHLGRLIDLMVDEGADLSRVHIVGHSLGAHIGGIASQNVKKGIVGRITGLDPAGPMFLKGHDSSRLDRSDADFVDCIHTNHGFLGISSPVCDADFFVNGGRVQPGCCEWVNVGKCGHMRSTVYFIESISKNAKFEAYSCAGMPDFEPVTCTHNGAVMGVPANKSFHGIYYVETGVERPFHKIPSKEKLEETEAKCFSTNPVTWILESI